MKFYRIVYVKAPSYRKVFTDVVEGTDKRNAKRILQRRVGRLHVQILSIAEVK